MKFRSAFACIPALLVISGCGGSNPANPGSGGANFTAKIDGVSWTSATAATAATGSAGGTFSIVGSPLVANADAMSLTLYNVSGPGPYPLGVGGLVVGGTAVISKGASAWSTPLSGAAGTAMVTAVSATHITGTFSYVAEPFLGSPPGNRTVTDGSFDLPVTSSGSVTVPANAGSKVSGMLAGAPWNAATVVMVSPPSSGTVSVGWSNRDYSVNVIVSGWTGVGNDTLGTGAARQITVTRMADFKTWGGSGGRSGGIITVTTSSATRIKGSYDVLLQPGIASPGVGALALTGTFDIGIP